MESSRRNGPILLRNIKVTDEFFGPKQELVRTQMLPFQWKILNNEAEGAKKSYCIRNFEVAARIQERKRISPGYAHTKFPLSFEFFPEEGKEEEERFYGMVFQDSDVYKWIEAASYSLAQQEDKELEQIIDGIINKICAAQREDGYLDTFYIINDPAKIFTNLAYHHELYCLGHLIEAGIAYYEISGKKRLLNAAERFSMCVSRHIGMGRGKKRGYPGHEIAEMALIRLYEVTKKKEYLNLSKYFLEERGKQPYYFNKEQGNDFAGNSWNLTYNQSHLPVKEQSQAVGHAVRATYLYTGMAEMARVTEDDTYYLACCGIFNDITQKKMYITGGIGSSSHGESFTFGYDLPNDTAYAETCGAIGLIFFARRMLQIEPKAYYGDIMERALYNGVLAGMALDGKSFFYVNPLEVLPEACEQDPGKKHVLAKRNKWFSCACCPPNLARLIESIAQYAYTEAEHMLLIHLFIGGTILKDTKEGQIAIQIESKIPYEGSLRIMITEAKHPADLTIGVRIPDWCQENYTLSGENGKKLWVKDGYLYIEGMWQKDNCILFHMEMKPVFFQADWRVRENAEKIALMRGPIVYCMEEADNGKNLHLYCADPKQELHTEVIQFGAEKIYSLKSKGTYKISKEYTSSLYEQWNQNKAAIVPKEITWIPYYAWANRNLGEMQVWVKESNSNN